MLSNIAFLSHLVPDIHVLILQRRTTRGSIRQLQRFTWHREHRASTIYKYCLDSSCSDSYKLITISTSQISSLPSKAFPANIAFANFGSILNQ